MPAIHVVHDPRAAALLAAPIRRRILEALAEPASATQLAERLGVSRQGIAYHVRQLEAHGFLELDREEARRGCTERILRRTARAFVASNEVFGTAGLDPEHVKDRFSSEYLLALAGRMTHEVGLAQAASERKGARLPTLGTDVAVRLPSPERRQAFAEELLEAITRIAAKYHDESAADGRDYRVVLGAYPIARRKSHAR